ncbi:MAG: alanine--tRNA ligase [Candidatus Moraniibacteriota bacterium]|nr:MAG: alanine--tRNA ligase [Candidatus Moranbacteria bacterium]
MTAEEIRKKYLEFFGVRGHAIVPSSSLVPENDPTTLFTGSGMQPMVPYLLGEPHPLGKRIADSQKCFRAQDIEEVGDNRHTTFFEMLGNWSFGDYFKREQIAWMWEFLTVELALDPNRLYFTCYGGNETLGIPRDTEAAALWQNLFKEKGIDTTIAQDAETKGLQGARIFYYGDKKNWWSRVGVPLAMPVGEPGGPDTEMFWDFGEQRLLHEHSVWKNEPCHVNCDCGRFMEIGNNVFMQYVKTENGFSLLPEPNVDFGGGLERMAVASMDIPDVFLSDLFTKTRQMLEGMTGKTYISDGEETRALRIIMDHIRVAVFLLGDGVTPSNTDRGYVLRRVMRRAIRYGDTLGLSPGSLSLLSQSVIDEYRAPYPALVEHAHSIREEIGNEEDRFRLTLEKGMKELERRVKSGKVSGKDVFDLFSTYGFPFEMTKEIAEERGIEVPTEDFQEEFKKHQELSRTASAGKFKGGLADVSEKTTALHTATHLLLAGLRKFLGESVHQAGSNITEERTRFDFTFPEKVSRETLTRVEEYVNEAIASRASVETEVLDKEVARASGVEGSFWEKYPDKVSVYRVRGENGTLYSQELCGGPHVRTTEGMGRFRIVKEEASSSGVRRIKAVLE